MFSFLLIASLMVSSSHLVEGRTLNSIKIVNYINNLEQNTWQADTYDSTEIDVNEFVRTRLGVKMIKRPPSPKKDGILLTVDELEKANFAERKSYISKAEETVPKSFTWVNESLTKCPIGNINDQSNCGSCWAVSSAAAFSNRLCLKTNGSMTTPLSSIYVTACDEKNYGCLGGYMSYVYKFFKERGLITGGEYDSDVGCQPYSIRPCGHPMATKWPCPAPTARTPKCKKTKCTNEWYSSTYEKKNYTISNFYYVGSSYNEFDIRQEIYNNGPVTATFWVYEDFMFYKNGIYEHREGHWPLGGHAVRVVGWGEENGVKYWLVANSWGKEWGEDGFFRIKRGVNMCWFESDVQAVTPNV